jgi:hypothetical protein
MKASKLFADFCFFLSMCWLHSFASAASPTCVLWAEQAALITSKNELCKAETLLCIQPAGKVWQTVEQTAPHNMYACSSAILAHAKFGFPQTCSSLGFGAKVEEWLDINGYSVSFSVCVDSKGDWGQSSWGPTYSIRNSFPACPKNYTLTSRTGSSTQATQGVCTKPMAPCPVEPLKLITDPDAIRFENGDKVRRDKLSATTEKNLVCLEKAVALERPAKTIELNSAWRPQSYQDHLREIYLKMLELDKISNKKNPSCAPIRSAIEAERQGHEIANLRKDGSRKPVGDKSNHTSGNAFDARWTTSDARIDELAKVCNLVRPYKDSKKTNYDYPHFENK